LTVGFVLELLIRVEFGLAVVTDERFAELRAVGGFGFVLGSLVARLRSPLFGERSLPTVPRERAAESAEDDRGGTADARGVRTSRRVASVATFGRSSFALVVGPVVVVR
jgi:hypothetical protein